MLNKRVEIEAIKGKASFNNDAIIIARDAEEYLCKLINRGVTNYITNRDDLGDFESLDSNLFTMNFYEFRRIIGSKNYFFLKDVCCVIYSDNPSEFQKEYAAIQHFSNKGVVFIHIVPEDFEVDAAGKRISAYIGNDITDGLMEE